MKQDLDLLAIMEEFVLGVRDASEMLNGNVADEALREDMVGSGSDGMKHAVDEKSNG